MANVTAVVAPIAVSCAITVAHDFANGNITDTIKVLIANASLLGALAAVGQFIDWELAMWIAILNLVYTMLNDGAPVIDWFSKLVNNA